MKRSISVIGMIVLYAFVALALPIMRRRLRSGVQRMDDVARAKLLREHAEVAEEFAPSVGVPWRWRVMDVVLGTTFAFGPPIIVSLARQQPLTLESEFTGYHLLATASGVCVYLLGRACVVRQWQQRRRAPNDAA